MKITGTSAIVSGGASGLGRATVEMLVRKGAQVVVIDMAAASDSPGGAETAIRHIAGDVTDPTVVEEAVAAAVRRGPLRIAVNCAGIATPGRVLRSGQALPLADFERVVRVNLIGTFNLVRLAALAMAGNEPDQGECGVIVNTASVAAYDGQVGQAAYSAAKAGIAGMTLPLARDLAQHLIRVVGIAPGMFRTPLLAGLPADAIESLGRQVPHPARVGEPAEFAALVEHVIENAMLNGEVIRIDGAIRMSPR